ncbi:hypothetical protein C0J52_27281 [Blattella germanica]|nr:hypothetical protein C0J52_27281 [Blattella germanica]
MNDYDGQMMSGDSLGLTFPKNFTQETCPDRESNPNPLRERRIRYPLLHNGPPWINDHDGQMMSGDSLGLKFPDICLMGEEKPQKNLTQETCPDRESNPGPLRERRIRYPLLHNDIIRTIKSRRLRWTGHILEGEPEGKHPVGRPRMKWENNINHDLREVDYTDRDAWRAYVRTTMNLWVQ